VAADRIGYVNSVDNSLVQMTWAQMMAALLPGAAASSFVRRNAGNTAYEHRTAAEVLSDIGALPLAGGTMTGDLAIEQERTPETGSQQGRLTQRTPIWRKERAEPFDGTMLKQWGRESGAERRLRHPSIATATLAAISVWR
jgi:hypothetical protein